MLAAIFGVSGQVLTSEERAFFRDVQPLGFILFARNVADPDQVRRLVNDLRASVEHAEAPVLIDQEGGRVQRLKPPHWRAAVAAAKFGALASQRAGDGRKAVFLNHQLIGAELAALGIDVDCAPLIDVQQPGAHDVIGDRAFGGDPEQVATLGRAAADGLMSAGITPVIKHIPGHGRSMVDSHHDLPRVTDVARGAVAHRLRAVQAPQRSALGHDRAHRLRGDRQGVAGDAVGQGHRRDHPRRDRV